MLVTCADYAIDQIVNNQLSFSPLPYSIDSNGNSATVRRQPFSRQLSVNSQSQSWHLRAAPVTQNMPMFAVLAYRDALCTRDGHRRLKPFSSNTMINHMYGIRLVTCAIKTIRGAIYWRIFVAHTSRADTAEVRADHIR